MFLMFSYPIYKSEEVEYLKRYLHQYMWENSAVYLTVLDFMGLPNKVTMKGFFFFYLGEAVTWQVIIKLLPGLRKQKCWASDFMVMNILTSRKQYNWFTNIYITTKFPEAPKKVNAVRKWRDDLNEQNNYRF